MQAHQLSKHWRALILLVAGMLALFALAACGGDDEEAPTVTLHQRRHRLNQRLPLHRLPPRRHRCQNHPRRQ